MGLAVEITCADGSKYRWGPDEWEAKNIPQNLSFSSAVPGGFTTATLNLPRRIDQDYPDLNLFDDAVIYGAGGEIAWEGRVAQLPRSHGSDFTIQVGCVGHAAHLKDDPSFKEIYVDTDLTGWQEPSVQRKYNLIPSSFQVTAGAVNADSTTGSPSLAQEIQTAWGATALPDVESWYDAKGITLGSLYYAWKKNSNISAGPDNWLWQAGGATDDVASGFTGTGDLQAAGPGSGTLTLGSHDWALVQLQWVAGGAGADNTLYGLYWTFLAVYGNHGLTKQGTEGATSAKGFFASDIVANIVSRAAPLLNYSLGNSIQATSFVIPQMAFRDPVTAEDAIMAVNAYHLYEWGVFENKEFFFRQPDPNRLTWQVRLSDGAQLDLEGDAGDAVYNGVLVRYTDPAGVTKTVGPPGSGADATDTSLVDTSSTNPVNAHGIPKKWATLDISQTTTQAGAIQLGAIWLAEQALPQRKGQVVITGTAKHPTAGDLPAWKIRAGDYIVIADHSANVARRVIDTTYSGNSVTCSLDNASSKLEAILDRLGFMVFPSSGINGPVLQEGRTGLSTFRGSGGGGR